MKFVGSENNGAIFFAVYIETSLDEQSGEFVNKELRSGEYGKCRVFF